jgi:hypothetical protein
VYKNLIAICTALTVCLGAIAQTTTIANPTPTATEVKWPNQILALQFELHETGYQINSSPENKMAVILSAEDLINDACLDISKNRNFEKKSDNSLCNQLINKTLKLDPNNPAAICAKAGASSQSCRAAYEKVTALMVKSDSKALKGKDVSAFLSTQYSGNTESVISELGKLTSQYYQKQSDDLKKQIISGYAAALDKECAVVAYEVDFEDQAIPTPTQSANAKPFENVLKELTAAKTSSITEAKYTHKRLVSVNCIDLLERLRQIFADSYPITCVLKTYFSPQCRNAILNFKKSFAGNAPIHTSSDQIGKF